MYPDRRLGSSARGASLRSRALDDIRCLRVDDDRLDDVLDRQSGETCTATHTLDRGCLVYEQARFVLRDEDDQRESDRRALASDLLGARACPLRAFDHGVAV